MKLVKFSAIVMFLLIGLSHVAWGEISYTVKDGDTLSSIAGKFHITLEKLLESNSLAKESILQPGQKLIIEYKDSGGKSADEADNRPAQSAEYKVRAGDCLDKIAKLHKCSIDDIVSLNKIRRDSVLKIDQVILIPSKTKAPSGKNEDDVTVKELSVDASTVDVKGKNLLDLSQLEDAVVSIDEIEESSPESTEIENTGESAGIEKVSQAESKPERDSTSDRKPIRNNNKFLIHTVKKGDTVSKLSAYYGVTESSIFDANNISGKTILDVGKDLKIPLSTLAEKRIEKTDNKTLEGSKLISRNITKRDKIVRKALEYQGVKYHYGGENLSKGVDCSGYVMKVYEKFGVKLPHNSSAQAGIGTKVEKNQLVPGDLVFFKTSGKGISHVGIYIGKGKFIHAATSNGKVQIDSLSDNYYASRYVTARRILEH
jgi:cell wall-associated NlpC family hydrolase